MLSAKLSSSDLSQILSRSSSVRIKVFLQVHVRHDALQVAAETISTVKHDVYHGPSVVF